MQNIAFVGLGAMGFGIAKNLHAAGLPVTGCDLDPVRLETFAALGAPTSSDLPSLLTSQFPILATCLAGKDMLPLCDKLLLPNTPPGTTLIDHATIPTPDTRRLHHAFAQRGVNYLPVPMSGGQGLADAGQLLLFIGATPQATTHLRPYFDAIGDPQLTYYAHDPDKAQVMKAVQNMASWYLDTIRMEIIAFGLHSGISHQQIAQACREAHQPGPFSRLLQLIAHQPQSKVLVGLSAEFDYFLKEADASGFPMPAMRGLMQFLHQRPPDTTDVVHRPAHHTWQRLINSATT